MTRRNRVLPAAVLAVALTISAGGCSDSGPQSPGPSGGTPDQVTYLTAFGAVGRDAFAWVAQAKGYFREAGFEVKIELGAGTDPNLKALAAGQAEFGSLDLTGVMIQAGRGVFKDVRGIAAVHQRTLVSIIALEGAGITTPKDLEGKKLAAATGSVNQLLFPAYARLAGIDAAKVAWVNTQPPQLNSILASGQVDALSTFLISRGGVEKAAGKKAIVLPYSDYLKDLFGNGIVTTSALADQNPKMVERFRDACLKALKYTIEHPEEAAEIMNKAQPGADKVAAVGEIKLMTPYVNSAGGPFGGLDQQRVATAISTLQGAGLIPAGLAVGDVIDPDLVPKA